MARTAASIITSALQIAKVPLYLTQAVDELNSLLRHIELSEDYSAARGQWNFFFPTTLISSGGGNIIQSAGVPLPIDYVRVPTSGGSTGAQRTSKWYFDGVPYDMVEIDLTEFDDQVQQAGINSYPYFWTKDLAQYQPIIEVTGDISGENIANLTVIDAGTALASIAEGMSIAGGIGPLSVIPPGATITGVAGSPPANLTISAAASAALTGATLQIGNPGLGLMYPPPSGGFAAMIRYQRRMPRLTQAQISLGAYPWFEDDMALVEGLAGLMCRYSDDSRVPEFIGAGLGSGGGRFGARMTQTRKPMQDLTNRAQTVQLDRRMFGKGFNSLKNTKTIGW